MLTMIARLRNLALVAVLAVAVPVLATSAAYADNGCYPDVNGVIVCPVSTGGGGGGGSTTAGSPAAFTPGPTSCSYPGDAYDPPQSVPCQVNGAWWSTSSRCLDGYVSLQDPQLPATGHDPQVGAWYNCTLYCPAGLSTSPRGCPFGASFWSDAPPAGITRYTPAQAAGLAKNLLLITSINIGMAPTYKVHSDDPVGTTPYRRTWVGIPVWLWVDNPTAQTWGPEAVTATYGGVTVTVTAIAGQVTWNSGGGQSVTCGLGTHFDEAAMANQAAVDSPTCGYRYQRQGNYTVTATTSWVVQWTGGGQNGTFAMPTTTSSAPVKVGQLESVNTPVTQAMLEGK